MKHLSLNLSAWLVSGLAGAEVGHAYMLVVGTYKLLRQLLAGALARMLVRVCLAHCASSLRGHLGRDGGVAAAVSCTSKWLPWCVWLCLRWK